MSDSGRSSWRRSWLDSGQDTLKRNRRVEQAAQLGDTYQPESLPIDSIALSHDFSRPMSLPFSALNSYFMDDPVMLGRDPDRVKRGWQLFRRLRLYELVATCSPNDLHEMLGFLYEPDLIRFYGKIHRDHIDQHQRRHATDSGYFSRPYSLLQGTIGNERTSQQITNGSLYNDINLSHRVQGPLQHPSHQANFDTHPQVRAVVQVQPEHTMAQTLSSEWASILNLPGAIPAKSQHNSAPLTHNASLPCSGDMYNTEAPLVSPQSHNSLGAQDESIQLFGAKDTLAPPTAAPTKMSASSTRPSGFIKLAIKPNIAVFNPTSQQQSRVNAPRNLHEKRFQCTYCDQRFAQEGYRIRHEKEKHDSLYNYKCLHDECVNIKPFASREAGLDKHRRKAHKDCNCKGCHSPEPVQVRPIKRGAACGACVSPIFRNTNIVHQRDKHIKEHYEGYEDADIYLWKTNHWKKSNIVKSFLRMPEVHPIWRKFKAVMAKRTPGYKLDLRWDNADEAVWNRFIVLIEFGGPGLEFYDVYLSPAHALEIVKLAYDMAQKSRRPPCQHSPCSSKTHSRVNSSTDDEPRNGGAALDDPMMFNPLEFSEIQQIRQHLPIDFSPDQGAVNMRVALRPGQCVSNTTAPSSNSQLPCSLALLEEDTVSGESLPVNLDPNCHIGANGAITDDFPQFIEPIPIEYSIQLIQSQPDFMDFEEDEDESP